MAVVVSPVVPTKMVMLIALMLLLQIWITAGSECGFAPNVTLNCTEGSAHVEWVASRPGCQYDCKAHWICVNGTDTHKDESSDLSCNTDWDFSIPWDHYFCNVTVFYKYDITIFESETSPPTTESCSQDSIELQYDDHFEVGRPHEINCTLYTGKVVNSDNVSISWNGPYGDIANESGRITVIPTISDGHIHTSTLQFSYISEEDEDTSYNCTASLSGEHELLSESFTMGNLTVPPPDVSVTALDAYPAVGKSFSMKCTVTVAKGIIIGSVNITWIFNDTVILENEYNLTDSTEYVSWYNIAELQPRNNNTEYYCNATINTTLMEVDVTGNITIVNISLVKLQYDDHFEVGRPHEINCILYTGEVVNSDNVSISWNGPNGIIANESSKMTVIPTTSDGHIHTSTLQFSYISEEDEDTSYICTTFLYGEYELLTESFTIRNLTVLAPNVSVTALDANPAVGKSFPMMCTVTVAKGIIIGSVNITWIFNGTEFGGNKYNLTNSAEYVSWYNITKLQPRDNNTVYYCKATINTALMEVDGNDSIKIDSISLGIEMEPTSNSKNNPLTIILSTIAVVITVGFTICFIGYLIYKGKRNFKFARSHNEQDEPVPMPPIDDNYTVRYGGETSTIDYEYLKSHDKMKKWLDDYLDMPTVDEERSTIRSPSITDEKMLDYVHGHSTKEPNTNPVSVHDTEYSNSMDIYNIGISTKNDYSGSNETVPHENGLYISEDAAFYNAAKKKVYITPQEESHLNNVIEEEGLVQSKSSQITSVPSGYVTLEDQLETDWNKQQGKYTLDSSTSGQHSPRIDVSAEEENKNNSISRVSEGDKFSYATAEIDPTSNSLTSPTLTDGNITSPPISEGEYLPYTTAIGQEEYLAIATFPENNNTGLINVTSPESVKQEIQSTDNFPYLTLKDNSFHVGVHTNSFTDERTAADGIDKYDTSCTDIMPHSESCSEVFPYVIIDVHQDKCADHDANADKQLDADSGIQAI